MPSLENLVVRFSKQQMLHILTLRTYQEGNPNVKLL